MVFSDKIIRRLKCCLIYLKYFVGLNTEKVLSLCLFCNFLMYGVTCIFYWGPKYEVIPANYVESFSDAYRPEDWFMYVYESGRLIFSGGILFLIMLWANMPKQGRISSICLSSLTSICFINVIYTFVGFDFEVYAILWSGAIYGTALICILWILTGRL